jgi:hypothetical protein
MNDLLKRRGFVVKPIINLNNNHNKYGVDSHLNYDLNHNNKQVLDNKKIINNKLTNKSIQLLTNSLISDSPLHQLIPNLRNNSNLRKLAEEKKFKIIRGRFDSNEDKILTNNWNKFCDKFNVNEDMKIHLLGYFVRSHEYSKEDRKKLRDFMRRENFYYVSRMVYQIV